MDQNLLASIGHFSGINNVDPDVRLVGVPGNTPQGVKTIYPLGEALNVDIDNTYGLSTRDGHGTLQCSGSDTHSLWSNGDGWPCFYVDGSGLYRLMEDFSKLSLLSGLSLSSRMSYAPWGNLKKIYMTNGSYIGYYQNEQMNALVNPSLQFKQVLPPGQKIAYHSGRLYVAASNSLYIADAMCDHYDTRYGIRLFANRIDMLIAVNDGLYIADGKITWFLEGLNPQETMHRYKVLDSGVIPYSEVIINGQDLKDNDGVNYAMWLAPTGVCLGGPGGKVKNLTGDSYQPPAATMGSPVIRDKNGTVHYVISIQ